MNEIEAGDVRKEKADDDNGVEHRVAADEVIENVVRSSVTAAQEHIVVIQQGVGNESGDAEGDQNGEGDPHIFALELAKPTDHNVQRSKARDGMGDTRDDVGEGQDGIGIIVLSCAIGAEDGAQNAENADEIQRGLFDATAAECGQRERDQLNAAQKQGQIHLPCVGAFHAGENDFQNFKAVDQKGGPDQHVVFCFFIPLLVF